MVRGLKNTLPLHWDGTLGDPFGGGNGAVGFGGSGGTDCVLEHDCFVDLVEESLSGVMCDQGGSCPPGGNELSAQERDDMAVFLASVSYPPARGRRMDDVVTSQAMDGFSDFFMDQGGNTGDPDTCADSTAGCHDLPLGASTNSSTLGGFDAPTMRGLTDRFLQFSLGITNAEEILAFANIGIDLNPFGIPIVLPPLEPSIQWDPNEGFEEITTFGAAFALFDPVYAVRPLDMFQMLEQASTGHSGAIGRQVTLSQATTTGGSLVGTEAVMNALEAADQAGLINLRADGLQNGTHKLLSYRASTGVYQSGGFSLSHAQMISEAQAGTLVMTLTGALRQNVGAVTHPQPLLTTDGTGSGPTGDPPLPTMSSGGPSNPPAFTVEGVDVRTDAVVFVDGQLQSGATIACGAGVNGDFCVDGDIDIDLTVRPFAGTHLIQVQNPAGPLSNELPLCVGNANGCL